MSVLDSIKNKIVYCDDLQSMTDDETVGKENAYLKVSDLVEVLRKKEKETEDIMVKESQYSFLWHPEHAARFQEAQHFVKAFRLLREELEKAVK